MPQAANAPRAESAQAANASEAQNAQAANASQAQNAQAANASQAQNGQAANASHAQSAQAANAPRAETARANVRPARSERPRIVREHAAPWGADTQPPAFPAGSDPFDITGDTYAATPPKRIQPITPAAVPVYASHPRRLGVAALLVALCVIVALVGFVVWKTRAGAPPAAPIADTDGDSSVMSTFPPDATPQRPARSGTTLPAEPTQSASTSDSTSVAGAAPPVRTPVEIKPLPAKPARKPVAVAPKPSPPPAPVATPEPVPTPAPPPVTAAPRKAAPVDRWAQMSEELSRCTREDFIARVICDQRVRFRYCDGYWGKTAQCPGNPVPDRGQ
ncbi:MAG TPA: hypothetical protein VJX31_10365 [Casimicrobiaceae bacterium]|nr:hypothetical protein [Casimicrobiaceae bacterium]